MVYSEPEVSAGAEIMTSFGRKVGPDLRGLVVWLEGHEGCAVFEGEADIASRLGRG